MFQEEELEKDLSFDPDLTKESITFPKVVFRWKKRLADAKIAAQYAERNYTRKKAEIMLEKRRAASLSGDKKPIAVMEMEAEIDPRVDATFQAKCEAERQLGYLEAAFLGIKEKSSSLISLTADDRKVRGMVQASERANSQWPRSEVPSPVKEKNATPFPHRNPFLIPHPSAVNGVSTPNIPILTAEELCSGMGED